MYDAIPGQNRLRNQEGMNMIINRLNQLYKPERTLYYIDASKEDIESFYKGVVPPLVEKYADVFGVYDYPGVFFVRKLQKEVIGIEFRNGDPRIGYPTEMRSLELDASFFYSIEIDNDAAIDLQAVRSLYHHLAVVDQIDLIQIFKKRRHV